MERAWRAGGTKSTRLGQAHDGVAAVLDKNMMGENVVVPVSVVIPCYRCSATIRRALASVAAQTMLPKEVILVEDASRDNGHTLDTLHQLASRYQSLFAIKIIALEKNGGAASARNRGWEVASQPYIAFLDADDAWHIEKIQRQYNLMAARPEVVLCGHAHKIVENSQAGLDWSLPVESQPCLIKRSAMLLKNPFVTPSVMLRRSLSLRFRTGQRYMEDHLLWMQIALQGGGVVRMSEPLVAIYKPLWGKAGLSAAIYSMGRNDMANYWRLYRNGRLSGPEALFWSGLAAIKFVRRLMVYWGWRKWR